MELVIARNPDPGSTLPYLIRVPLGEGLVMRTSDTWPRTKALFCYPVPSLDWPSEPEVVERVPLRSCARRGAAVDVVADRSREHRSQFVFTTARGRDGVFWQSPRTRKPARIGGDQPHLPIGPAAVPAPEPPTAEVRRWAVQAGLPVSDRGRLRPEIWQAWREAHRD